MMSRREVFEAWAPPAGVWSPWAKPVLFAHIIETKLEGAPDVQAEADWAPAPSARVALVVELPGAESAVTGLALARVGYQPVPLFNACPAPFEIGFRPKQLVDVDAILAILFRAAPMLKELPRPAEAPPAFLVDAERTPPLPDDDLAGLFDNRSVHFATDFPSATFLAAHGIGRAVLVRRNGERVASDLVSTLHGWKRAGIDLASLDVDQPDLPAPLTVRSPGPLADLFRRLVSWLKYYRHPLGGFGGVVPEAAAMAAG